MIALRAVDVVQMDIAHCGGFCAAKKIAAMADVQDLRVAPHCSIGPVALAACLHFDISTPNFMIQEAFAEFDVPWRNELVGGWNPVRNGEFVLEDKPGLGLSWTKTLIAVIPMSRIRFPASGTENGRRISRRIGVNSTLSVVSSPLSVEGGRTSFGVCNLESGSHHCPTFASH